LFDALRHTPDVISLQAGTTTRNDLKLLGFDVLFNDLRRSHGTALVAAAGNDGSRRPFWPAAFDWAVAVGALTEDGSARASWSNFGPWVDVYAVGEHHVNAFATGQYVTSEAPVGEARQFAGMARWSGTSFSTPYVAGCIAAQMSGRGVSAQHAWQVLFKRARRHALPGVGPVLRRDMACIKDPAPAGSDATSGDAA
jgi:subtilisin family serine protease